MKILYLTAMENTECNAIHFNQVISLQGKGVDYDFLFLSPLFILNKRGFKINRNKFENTACHEFKLPIFSYHFGMHIIFIPYFILISIIPFILNIYKIKPNVVHCRNLVSSLLAVCAKYIFNLKYKIVCDPRSVYVEECVISHRFKFNGVNYKLWKSIERTLYRYCDACIGLSEYFKDYLYQYNKNSFFVPAVVNSGSIFSQQKRSILRLRHNLSENDFVCCYIGSIDLWHSKEKLCEYLKKIQDNIEGQNFKIVFLSGNKIVCNYIINKFGEPTIVKCGRVQPSEVLEYLLISDLGIVPGSDNEGYCYDLLYKTMISSKAEEYLVAGLPIYVNSRISSLNSMIKNLRAGLSSDQPFDFKTFDRENISAICVKLFGVNEVVSSYEKIYRICCNN
jgi:hypothetical protein